MDINIEVTENAIEYLKGLLETVDIQDPKGPKTNIKVFVENGGTPHAETMLTYCKESEKGCLLYTSPSPRDGLLSRMPSSA